MTATLRRRAPPLELPTILGGLGRRPARGSHSVRKVLLVAEPGVRAEELAAMLGDAGYQVAIAADGFELLNAWTFPWLASGAQPFGVIVTDGVTPLLSGAEAIGELQRFSDCRAIRVAVDGPDRDIDDFDDVLRRVRLAFSLGAQRKGRVCA